jgi:DNA-binding GntR family transcriptional regulator
VLIQRQRSVTSQVNSILSERIRTQEYAPGSRLPSETDLAAEFGVSRASIRTALGQLATAGLVIRKQGDGTYVNAHLEHIPMRHGAMWNFTRLIEHNGYRPEIRVLAQEVRPATAAEMAALALELPEPLLALTRLFYADDTPAILAHSTVPLGRLLAPLEELQAALPISDFVHRYLNTDIAYVIFNIEACMPDGEASRVLQLPRNTPLLKLIQVFYDKMNQPVFYSVADYHDKLIPLRLAQAWE